MIERDARVPRDYRMLVSVGPFGELEPDETIVFQIALVVGAGREGMIENANKHEAARRRERLKGFFAQFVKPDKPDSEDYYFKQNLDLLADPNEVTQ